MRAIISFYSKLATTRTRATLLALLVFLLPFERIPSFDVASVTVRLSQLVALALIFVSIGPIVNYYRALPRLPKLLLPTFLLSYLLSTLLATDAKRAVMVFAFTCFVALIASAIAATFSADQLPRLEKYLFAATAIVLAFGFYQYLGNVLGLSSAWTGLRDIYSKEVFGFPRIQSTGLEPLYYGSFLLVPYCILLAKKLGKTTKLSVGQSILLTLIIAQVLLTVSRGAIYGGVLATLALIAAFLLKQQTSGRRLLSLAASFAVAGVLALIMTWIPLQITTNTKQATKSTEKLIQQTGNFDSQDDRQRNRNFAVAAFKEHPLLGMGPGNFSQYAIQKYPPYAQAAPVIVNNEPLELLAEAGIMGFVLFVLFAAWTYFVAAAGYVKNVYRDAHLQYWAPALLAYLIALAIQYQTFSTLYVTHVWVIIGLVMAFGAQRALAKK